MGGTATDYVPHSEQDVREMLSAVGAASIDELFSEIPDDVRRREPLALPAGLSEAEVLAELRRLAAANTPATQMVSFLGAGVYDHYIPSVVDAVVSRSEFFTAYTPYQPERSQGLLQSIFEYQTAITELTGMAVSNASMYDAGTALAEAVILAGGQTRRGLAAVSAGVHPEYRQVLFTESVGQGPCPRVTALRPGGATDLEALRAAVGPDTAAVVVQQPNFLARSRTCAAPLPSLTRPVPCWSWSPIRWPWACSRRPAPPAPTSSWARPRCSAAA